MESASSGAWLLDVTSSTTTTLVTWLLYLRYLVVPVLLVKIIKCYLWPCFVKRRIETTRKFPLPPGNYGWPLIGETLDFVADGRKYYRSRIAKNGLIFTSHLLTQPFVVVAGAENVRKILYSNESLVTDNPPPGIRYLVGEGAFYTTNKDEHRFRQRCMRRNFTEGSLSTSVPEIQKLVRKHLKSWCHKGNISGVRESKRLTFEVHSFCSLKYFLTIPSVWLQCFQMVSQVLMGLYLSEEEVNEMQVQFEVFSANFFCLPLDYPGSAFKKTMNARSRMLEIVQSHLDKTDSDASFIDLVLNSSSDRPPGMESITPEHGRSMFVEMLFGSNETTSSTMCSIIMRLSKNPQIVQRIVEEVQRFTQDGEEVTYDTLKQMTYVNDVVKEVLRLDPPVAAGFRKVVKSFELGGYTIPKDWSIMYCIVDTHEQDSLFAFKDRMEFNPDRWHQLREQYGTPSYNDFTGDDSDNTSLDNNADVCSNKAKPKATIPERHHYIPFGGGTRRCAGSQFAKLYLNVLIIELCSMTTWKMQNENPKIKTAPLPFPADGLPLMFSALSSTSSTNSS